MSISDETQVSAEPSSFYVDTSVALRIVLGHSTSAVDWFNDMIDQGARMVSSRLLELEMTRALRRESLPIAWAEEFIDRLLLLRLDDPLLVEAAAIRPHIKTLDALHLASAQRIGPGHVAVVTHDANMARVAEQLGFDVVDPIT